MLHCGPDELALAALGERLDDEQQRHLDACDECRDEVASLSRAVVVAQSGLPADAPSVPVPGRVWEQVAAATGVSSAPRALEPEPVPTPRADRGLVAFPGGGAGSGGTAEARSTPGSPRVLLGAVAASLVVGAGLGAGGALVATSGDDAPTPAATVAQAALDPLGGADARGSAAVLGAAGDATALQVDLQAPPPEGGYYEVWLLDRDAQRLVPVGVVRADGTAVLDLPAGLDLDEFPVVDVSVEPLDGDPGHSGASVVRGVLEG